MLIFHPIVLNVLLATSVQKHQLNISLTFVVLAIIVLKEAQPLFSIVVQQDITFKGLEQNHRMNA
jgi:hypothetical protein